LATTETSLERGMPANIEAERSILGAILLDNFSYNEAAQSLKAEEFFLDSHRRIFLRMMDLAENGRPIDIISLTEQLGRNKEVEAIGGVAYLASLTDGVARRASIEQHIRIVKDKALMRGIVHAANNAVARAMEQSESAADVLNATEGEFFRLSDTRLGEGFQTIPKIVSSNFGSIDALIAPGQHITGLATHFDDFDTKTRGLQPSDLIIIAARPSMGKTAFAMNIAENAAVMDGKVVGVFSLEMSAGALVRRMLCSQARVDSQRLNSGFLGREDREKVVEAAATLAEAPIFIDDTPAVSVQEVRARARRLQHENQGRLDLLVVDYLQLMSATPVGGGKRFENRTQEVSAISRGLKAIAKELRVPVVALSQLSRAPEARTGDRGRKPQLSDLRESGSIEQDADVVAFIYREEMYMDREEAQEKNLDGVAELIIGKQRNGPTDTVKLAFLKHCTRFGNLATE
jgi:replicative DNA helicase